MAARAAKRRRSTSSLGGLAPLPPPNAEHDASPMQQPYVQQHAAPQLQQSGQDAPPLTPPVVSYGHAAPSTWHAGWDMPAVQHHHAQSPIMQEPLLQGMCYPHPAQPYWSQGSQGPPHPHPQEAIQHVLNPGPGFAGAQEMPLAAVAGHFGSASNPPGDIDAAMHTAANAQVDSRLPAGQPATAAAPVRKAFGGILNGVVKEAAETSTKRPPVFRYEDFKTVRSCFAWPCYAIKAAHGMHGICCTLCL